MRDWAITIAFALAALVSIWLVTAVSVWVFRNPHCNQYQAWFHPTDVALFRRTEACQ